MYHAKKSRDQIKISFQPDSVLMSIEGDVERLNSYICLLHVNDNY
jgi:hypothetical protein